MITILGVAHVFDIKQRVKSEIISRNPAVVAVELDRGRYAALKSGSRDDGNAPLIYRAMALIQKRIADEYGVMAGSEMLVAVEAAGELGAAVALIDLPAQEVFNRLMRTMSIKEKIYLIFGVIAGLFASKEKIEKEIDSYQKNEDRYMAVLEENMPSVTRILIDERNVHMARNIRELEERYGSVVAVVGDGHVGGLIKEMEGSDLEVIRLRDIKDTPQETGDEYRVSFRVG